MVYVASLDNGTQAYAYTIIQASRTACRHHTRGAMLMHTSQCCVHCHHGSDDQLQCLFPACVAIILKHRHCNRNNKQSADNSRAHSLGSFYLLFCLVCPLPLRVVPERRTWVCFALEYSFNTLDGGCHALIVLLLLHVQLLIFNQLTDL